MNAELSTFRQLPSRLLVAGVLILLLASSATLALASSGSEGENPYAAAWERYLAAGTPEDLAPQNLGKTWDRFLALQNMEPVGAFLVRSEVGGADLAASRSSEDGSRYSAAWVAYEIADAEMAASRSSEGENRYAAAWERYLAAQTPEALGDLGGTWARFWDTQAVEAVGAYLVPMDMGGADLAASRGLAAANRYAAAWQNFLATQNPQSLAPGNLGNTWALFWANVEAGGIVEREDGGFEVVCCR
jgi:hypothetical protein